MEPFPDVQLRAEINSAQADPQLLLHLTDAKNAFSAQLPNMGADYTLHRPLPPRLSSPARSQTLSR
jgi:hypothetical protein